MRSLFLIVLGVILLSACADEVVEERPVNDEVDQEEINETDAEELLADTSDPLEAGNINNNIEVFNDEFDYTYLIKEYYTNDDTDADGFNTMDFEGYEVTYSIVLMENTEENNVIGFFVETVNNTDQLVQYNMDMEIATDGQEQIENDMMYGIGQSDPGIKTKGFTKANIEYDIPDEIGITFEPPWDDEDEFNEAIGEPIEVQFVKE